MDPTRLLYLLVMHLLSVTNVQASPSLSDCLGPNTSQYEVKNLPSVHFNIPPSWSGGINIPGTTDDELFFWLFEAESAAQSDNLIIWLNGGPGCSSLEGLTIENGPLAFYGNATKPVANPYSWTKLASILYIDQPVGTGYSTGSSQALNNAQLTEEFYAWLMAFYDVFPALKSRKTYIMGESYAGTYIPYITEKILQNKKDLDIDLKSITIGDGTIGNIAAMTDVVVNPWLHQQNQHLHVPQDILEVFDKADQRCGFANVLKALTYPPHGKITVPGNPENNSFALSRRQAASSGCSTTVTTAAQVNESIYGSCNGGCATFYTAASYLSSVNPCFDVYNLNYTCKTAPNVTTVTEYMNLPEVRAAIHAPNKTIEACNNTILGTLTSENVVPPAYSLMPNILQQKVPIHLYSGDYDFLLNHIGTELVIQNMTWSGKQGFSSPPNKTFLVNGKRAGNWGYERGLSYHHILNAGHQFSHDQPATAFAYVRDFVIGNAG